MRATSSRRRRFASLGVIVAIAAAAALTAGATSAGAAGPTAHPVTISPPVVKTPQFVTSAGTNQVVFGCQDRPINGSKGARCYQPFQMQTAYGVTPFLNAGINGTGRTIVIIDAFQNPFINDDLRIFDQTFGLPAPPSFKVVVPVGKLPPFNINDPNMDGWAFEISLDVQWAHAIAPGANIVLAEAASNNDSDILATTKAVIDQNMGDIISQSFGEAEQCMDPALRAQQHVLFEQAARKGMTVFASSGDSGAAQFNCDGTAAILAASTPASDPNVTGVGGTTLFANAHTGAYISETAWTEIFGCNPPAVAPEDVNCSGGGFSTLFARPPWQPPSPQGTGRGVPDVAYDAGVNGGVLTHCGVCNVVFAGLAPNVPVFFIFGGTSAGSPQWAGLIADGDQLGNHRMGLINPALYQIAASPMHAAALHDITTGNNHVAELGGAGFEATPGWDPVTGLGTPNAVGLLPALVGLTS